MRQIGTKQVVINGQMVTVKVFATPLHREAGLGMTKPKFQRRRGREAGGRWGLKEGE